MTIKEAGVERIRERLEHEGKSEEEIERFIEEKFEPFAFQED